METKVRARLVISFEDFFELLKLPKDIKATGHFLIDLHTRTISLEIEANTAVRGMLSTDVEYALIPNVLYKTLKQLKNKKNE